MPAAASACWACWRFASSDAPISAASVGRARTGSSIVSSGTASTVSTSTAVREGLGLLAGERRVPDDLTRFGRRELELAVARGHRQDGAARHDDEHLVRGDARREDDLAPLPKRISREAARTRSRSV